MAEIESLFAALIAFPGDVLYTMDLTLQLPASKLFNATLFADQVFRCNWHFSVG